jgi:enediyne core biosynthesis thioesterase
MRHFEYRLTLGLQETNVVGNVYFANYFLWQGKCREEFLRRHAPQVLEEFKAGFGMITKECSCVFHQEAFAFQEIVIQMGLERLTRTGMSMIFDYYRQETAGSLTRLAQGRQEAIWVSPEHRVALLPAYLYEAIAQYAMAGGAGSRAAPSQLAQGQSDP